VLCIVPSLRRLAFVCAGAKSSCLTNIFFALHLQLTAAGDVVACRRRAHAIRCDTYSYSCGTLKQELGCIAESGARHILPCLHNAALVKSQDPGAHHHLARRTSSG
jgi:hypothetical protein